MSIFEQQRDTELLSADELDSAETQQRQNPAALSNSARAALAMQARAAGQEPEGPQKERKQVSGAAMSRLGLAQEAIDHAKEVFEFGAGNQATAIVASNSNSYYRMKAVRNSRFWEMTDKVKQIASQNPDALKAAKCEIAQGGNCGEHSSVAFDYLRVAAAGKTISRSTISGFDHAFVIMGDQTTETDSELVVSDAWPTAPTACLWEDFFAHVERDRIENYQTITADGQNVSEVIKAGLKMTQAGLDFCQKTDSDEKSQERSEESWVWSNVTTVEPENDYEYYTEDE